MNDVIGQLLPLAVGIAVSPIPVIASILMLMSPRARTTSLGFLLGWILGIAVVTALFTVASSMLPEREDDGGAPILGTIQLVLGVVLLLLAVRQWRGRPRDATTASLPNWMKSIDQMKFLPALGLGLLLAAVNPKNLLLGASAGVSLGSSGTSVEQTIVLVILFTIVAGSTVLAPVLAYLIAADALRVPLNRLREWLEAENAVIMTVLLLILGTVVLAKGIAAFG
ncbi:GAP family protein [Microbacterium foliorum]|uniref:GAP family protein n=1 Tax=Microbacterium foliorum TaxID=104336 RepID=A0A4Y5YQ50_9MICO|nr:GAP family protein [Microbacterium foliorum]QDE34827.1 GAP family protein [Microbacterium foliorum]